MRTNMMDQEPAPQTQYNIRVRLAIEGRDEFKQFMHRLNPTECTFLDLFAMAKQKNLYDISAFSNIIQLNLVRETVVSNDSDKYDVSD